jgi:hypothetical protein
MISMYLMYKGRHMEKSKIEGHEAHVIDQHVQEVVLDALIRG